MRGVAVVLAVLAAAGVGLLAFVLLGPLAAVGVAVLFLLLGVAALRVGRSTLPSLLAVLALVTLAAGGVIGFGVYSVLGSLGGSGAPPATADPDALASLDGKLDALTGGPFTVELTEAELAAVVQQGLAANPSAPVRAVALDLRAADGTLPGRLGFVATLASGGLQASGELVPRVDAGHVALDVVSVSLGGVPLPGLANGAVAGLLDQVAALDQALTDLGAEVSDVLVRDDALVVSGTLSDGAVATAQTLLDSVRAAAAGNALPPVPAEVYGPGLVDGTAADGSPLVIAVGDSLVAGTGVATQREALVSRFHAQVQARDGAQYGLANVGIVGASSGSLLTDGQLEFAADIANVRGAAYIVVSVGANDLLTQLGSPECSQTVQAPACQQRVADATAAFRANLPQVLDQLRAAAPDARLLYLTPYNPFDLGFGSQVEADTTAATQAFNTAAAEIARAHGALVADGQATMAGRTAVVTHMLDATPDIHPTGVGYDLLTGALLAALG